jgi:hypothetical protein
MLLLTSRETQVLLLAIGELRKKQIENIPVKLQEIRNLHSKAFDLIHKAPRPCGLIWRKRIFIIN